MIGRLIAAITLGMLPLLAGEAKAFEAASSGGAAAERTAPLQDAAALSQQLAEALAALCDAGLGQEGDLSPAYFTIAEVLWSAPLPLALGTIDQTVESNPELCAPCQMALRMARARLELGRGAADAGGPGTPASKALNDIFSTQEVDAGGPGYR